MNQPAKYIILLLFGSLLIGMACISCATSGKPEKQSMPMEFTIAKGYFVKNTIEVKEPVGIIFQNQQQIDSIMGMAATMGVNGKPTSFDFMNEYGVACVFPETDSSVALQVLAYSVSKGVGRLSVKVKTGEKQTYRIVPNILIKVSGIPPGRLIVERTLEGK